MRTRNHDWFDTKRRRQLFSFQVRIGGIWCNVHNNGKPCIYDTEAERDESRAAMRKQPEPSSD
jgi:hypothetical protein